MKVLHRDRTDCPCLPLLRCLSSSVPLGMRASLIGSSAWPEPLRLWRRLFWMRSHPSATSFKAFPITPTVMTAKRSLLQDGVERLCFRSHCVLDFLKIRDASCPRFVHAHFTPLYKPRRLLTRGATSLPHSRTACLPLSPPFSLASRTPPGSEAHPPSGSTCSLDIRSLETLIIAYRSPATLLHGYLFTF